MFILSARGLRQFKFYISWAKRFLVCLDIIFSSMKELRDFYSSGSKFIDIGCRHVVLLGRKP